MFKIGEFTKIAQVSGRLLRYYDDIDQFKPQHTDPWTGYRYLHRRPAATPESHSGPQRAGIVARSDQAAYGERYRHRRDTQAVS
jgi:hypothetical protein